MLQKFGPLVEERTVKLLSPWISCMLSGASSLEHADIGVELLQCLPASRRKALRSLYVRACFKLDARAEPDIQQAVMDCQQLRSLAIICNFHDWSFHQLDLRNLVHLRSCRLKLLPAPAQGVFLAQGETELTINLGHVTAWSKLWPQLQNSVHSMRVEGYPYLSGRTLPAARLQGWPEGLDAFHGLQVLHMFCREFRPYWSEGSLDLAHLAYIPHVSLHCKGDLDVKISKGTWKILKLQSTKAFALAISDPTAFMAGTEFFSFVFSCKNRPHAVIEELEKVGDETGATLYEYHDKCHSKHVTSKKHDFHLVKFSNREVNERSNENFVSISMEGTRSWKRQLGFEATMGTSQSRPGGAPRGAPPGFERPSPQVGITPSDCSVQLL